MDEGAHTGVLVIRENSSLVTVIRAVSSVDRVAVTLAPGDGESGVGGRLPIGENGAESCRKSFALATTDTMSSGAGHRRGQSWAGFRNRAAVFRSATDSSLDVDAHQISLVTSTRDERRQKNGCAERLRAGSNGTPRQRTEQEAGTERLPARRGRGTSVLHQCEELHQRDRGRQPVAATPTSTRQRRRRGASAAWRGAAQRRPAAQRKLRVINRLLRPSSISLKIRSVWRRSRILVTA